jgi:hypothetical protein
MEVRGQYHAPAAFTVGKEQLVRKEEAGWASETFWRREKRFIPAGIGTFDLFLASSLTVDSVFVRRDAVSVGRRKDSQRSF